MKSAQHWTSLPMTNSSIGHIWILYWEDYFTLTACGYSLMCESPLYTNKVLRVLKWRGSITTLQTCQDSADHTHRLFFFTMLLRGLHNLKRSLAMWFLIEVQIQRWSSTQKWPETQSAWWSWISMKTFQHMWIEILPCHPSTVAGFQTLM